MSSAVHRQDRCKPSVGQISRFRSRLPGVAEAIIASCADAECYTHVDYEPIPIRQAVVATIGLLRDLLFPGFFSLNKVDPVTLRYSTGKTTAEVFDLLSEQICHSIRHDCLRYNQACEDCESRGHELSLRLLEEIPAIRRVLATDVRAIYDGDPAAKSHDEIIFSYPGIFAITVYRVAHRLHALNVPLLPRIMTEHAHSVTGIDIHPGAEIGERFAIDHGTGIVIGETSRIGRNVRLYQGVTLGALSLPRNAGETHRGKKRHPTIEDDVIIYSGATILGGDTVIGARSVIGGNVWITASVPADTLVVIDPPRLIYKSRNGETPVAGGRDG
ncbi:MAG: serine acetyltransferase [Desulfobacterales bacterium]|jgi:serine O-acetyltransferase|nr:serine acetyltransferase [Desulfobacterales bacterium]